MPAAPARFSMTTGTLRVSARRCEILRAAKSEMPPGAKGTTTRSGLAGYDRCACAHRPDHVVHVRGIDIVVDHDHVLVRVCARVALSGHEPHLLRMPRVHLLH